MPKVCPEATAGGRCRHPKSDRTLCVLLDSRAVDCKLRRAMERVEPLVYAPRAPKVHATVGLKGRPEFVGPPKPVQALRNERRRLERAARKAQAESAQPAAPQSLATPFDVLLKGTKS